MTTLIVPLDGSALAERALRHAVALATRLPGGRVMFVMCAEELNASQTHYLDDRAALYADLVAIDCQVVQQEPVTGIEQACSAVADPVVCMATHGRGGWRSAAFGSVANEVIATSERPVVLIGPECRTAILPGELGRVVACADGSVFADAILPVVRSWSADLDLTPWFVEVVPPEEQVRLDGEPIRNLQVEAAADELGRRVQSFLEEGLLAEKEVLHGADPAQAIADFAERLPAALVAMATHGRKGLGRLTLGSMAMAVVRTAPCPVLLLRPPPATES
jgi:nucleotide-binding universal stress UspA family protein